MLPEYRSRGVGYALFKYCAEEALKRGCGRFEWIVLDWNSHAINFYKRLGAKHMQDWHLYRLDLKGCRISCLIRRFETLDSLKLLKYIRVSDLPGYGNGHYCFAPGRLLQHPRLATTRRVCYNIPIYFF